MHMDSNKGSLCVFVVCVFVHVHVYYVHAYNMYMCVNAVTSANKCCCLCTVFEECVFTLLKSMGRQCQKQERIYSQREEDDDD